MRTKVIHIIGTMDIGGAENLLINLLAEFDLRAYDVEVYYLVGKGSLVHKLSALGVPCYPLNTNGERDFLQISKLVSLFKQKKPHIVHTHVHAANYWIALACKIAGVPILIETIHDQHRHSRIKLPFIYVCEKVNSRLASHVVAVSEGVRRYIIDQFSVDEQKTVTIYNGVSTKHLNDAPPYSRLEFGIKETDFVIGCVANLIPKKKGYEYLIPAFAGVKEEIPNAKLLIVGEGPLREEIIQKSQKLKITNDVLLLGQRNDVFRILPLMDIFVLASLYEGTPMAVIEAMLFKKPIVATNVGGIPELIKDRSTGLLVAPGRLTFLKDAILVLCHDRKLAQTLGRRAYEHARENFLMERIAAQVHTLYQNLLAGKCLIDGI